MYTLDTNTIIYYLKGDTKVAPLLERLYKKDVSIYVSAITEVELFRFPQLGATEANQIDAFLTTVSIIPVESNIARAAAAVGRVYALGLADSVIAATALYTRSAVVTRNVRHFTRVQGLEVMRV